jgi:hypothetical protein
MTSVDRDTRATQTSATPSSLARVWAAYPVNPPLTHFAIGAYTTASVLAVIGAAGVSEPNMAKGWWLTLLVGLIGSITTAASGLVEFLALATCFVALLNTSTPSARIPARIAVVRGLQRVFRLGSLGSFARPLSHPSLKDDRRGATDVTGSRQALTHARSGGRGIQRCTVRRYAS